MANFTELLTSKSLKTFNKLIEDDKNEQERIEKARKEKERLFFGKHGFKTMGELIGYLKANQKRRVYIDKEYDIWFAYDPETDTIKHHVFDSNDIGFTTGYATITHTIDEMKSNEVFNRVNEYGYLKYWRDEKRDKQKNNIFNFDFDF